VKLAPRTPCLVTGASSGIGRRIALDLGARGCRVAVVARTAQALDELAAEIGAAGGEGLALPADVRDEEQVAAAVAAAAERFGGLRLVVANAGLGRYALVENQPAEHVETSFGINFVGMTRVVRHALRHLRAAAPSHVVGITSSAGLIPHRLGSAYAASKAASNAYLATLRLEVFDRGVGVSWICPGVVETPFLDKADFHPDRDLPVLARLTVRHLDTARVARATLRAVAPHRAEVVRPAMMGFYARGRRTTPRLADWLNRKTG
jgi:short-subunit dehydrogenase